MNKLRKCFVTLIAVMMLFTQAYTNTVYAEGEDDGGSSVTNSETVVNQQFFTDFILEKDEEGNDILSTKTGEILTTTIYAFNDNPNAMALTKLRVYMDQTTDNTMDVKCMEADKAQLVLSANLGQKALEVVATWGTLAKDDPANTKGKDLKYLEMELPSGASINLKLSYFVNTGYDKLVNETIWTEYMVADTETGEFPETWTSTEKEVTLSWIGNWGWEKFVKTSSVLETTYSASIGFTPNIVNYSFDADNLMISKKTGTIFTNTITLTDTLTLPEGLVFPEDYVITENRTVQISGADIYKVTLPEGDGYSVSYDSLSVSSDRKSATYRITVTCASDTDSYVMFNPVNKISVELDLNKLVVLDSYDSTNNNVVNNTASFKAESVDVKGESTLTYEAEASTQFNIDLKGEASLKKFIAQIFDENNKAIGAPNENPSEISIKDSYRILYVIQSTVTDAPISNMVIEDTMDAGLLFEGVSRFELFDISGSSLKTLVKDVDYTISTTSQNGKTVVKYTIKEVPANSRITITYYANVNTLLMADDQLTNVVRCGELEASVTVKTPEEGELTFKKEITSRLTKSTVGSTLYIRKIDSGEIYFAGDSTILLTIFGKTRLNEVGRLETSKKYAKGTPQYELLFEALTEFNAGDLIEYTITLDNQTSSKISGVIKDYMPFSRKTLSVTTDSNGEITGKRTDYNYYGQINGWRYYYVQPSNHYIYFGKYSKNYAEGTTPQYVYENAVTAATPYYSFFSNSYSDLNELNVVNYYEDYCQWNLTGDYAIHPYSSLKQTVILQVPGDNAVASTDVKTTNSLIRSYGNYDFQRLVAYYSKLNSNKFSSGAELEGTAIHGDETKEVSIPSVAVEKHTVATEMHISTGVVATVETDNTNSFYSNLANDNKNYYKNSDNEAIVLYTYIYNDSAKPMNLNDYTVNLSIPVSFKWVGFTNIYPNGTQLYVNGVSDYGTIGNSAFNGVVKSNYNRGNILEPYGSQNYANYYNSDDIRVTVNSANVNTFKEATNNAGWKSISLQFSKHGSGDPIIPAYTGFYITYVVKATSVASYSNNGAYSMNTNYEAPFGASIQLASSTSVSGSAFMHQISTAVNPEQINTPLANVNHGITNSYKDSNNSTHSYYSANKAGNDKYMNSYSNQYTTPYYLYSIAGVKFGNEKLSVSVYKEALKNSGQDLNEEIPAKDLYENYDDYYWEYILNDGLHRTVDGTVTWKHTIENTGADNNYMYVDYSTLVDIIDSPYELLEIYVPKMLYRSSDAQGTNIKKEFENVIVELPRDDSGWTVVNANNNTYQFETTVNGLPIRVTRSKITGGTLGWGYDVSVSKRCTDATQYIIEFGSYKENGTTYYPLLATKNIAEESVEIYLTFKTNDSILTNYNSFALYNATSPALMKVETSKGVIRAASLLHNRRVVNLVGSTNTSNYTGPYPLGETAALLASGTVIEYCDWTDTSYTDGVKTLTLLDEDGNAINSINTRECGDMSAVTLGQVLPGDKVHVQLTQENVLNESENYESYNLKAVYDVWGIQEGIKGAKDNAYNVDFSTVKVTYGLGDTAQQNKTETLVLGTDYDIYYTTSNLVVYEHHPITPVNTLTYAADIGNLEDESVVWIKYDPNYNIENHNGEYYYLDEATNTYVGNGLNTPEDYSGNNPVLIAGMKIGLIRTSPYYTRVNKKLETGQHLNGVYDTMFVDFDTVISDRITNDGTFPNVEAWSAVMNVKDSDEVKPFIEDTTALFVEEDVISKVIITKKTTDSYGSNLPADKDFKFIVIKSNSDNIYNTIYSSEVVAIAEVSIKANDITTIYNSDNLSVIWSKNDTITNKDFFDFIEGSKYTKFDFIEVSNAYNISSFTYNTTSTKNLFVANTYSCSIYGGKVLANTTDEQVNEFLSKLNSFGTVSKVLHLVINNKNSFGISCEAINSYKGNILTINKVDNDGAAINQEVVFNLLDADKNVVQLVFDKGAYYYRREITDTMTAVTDISFVNNTTINNLLPGDYYLHEVSAPEGYVTGDDISFTVNENAEFVIDGNVVTSLNVTNNEDSTVYNGSLTINKVDVETGAEITGSTTMFNLYNSKDADAKPLLFVKNGDGQYSYSNETGVELTSDLLTNEGKLSLDKLPFGTYYLVEVIAPYGYELANSTLESATEIVVSRTEINKTVKVDNQLIKGTIVLSKVDSTENDNGEFDSITGYSATFKVLDKDGNALSFVGSNGDYTVSANGTITELTTSKTTGLLKINGLAQGEYALEEVEAPMGYAIDNTKTSVTIDSNTPVNVTVENTPANVSLEVFKEYVLSGNTKRFRLKDVKFELYQVNNDKTAAAKIAEGTTDGQGKLQFSDLSWKGNGYYLVENVPEGYLRTGNQVKVYINDETGNIDLTIVTPTDGYTETMALFIDLDANRDSFEVSDNEIKYVLDILNIKSVIYGGLYGSVSYKTIDNYKSSDLYGSDVLSPEMGYSYFYTAEDYANGNYNYVHAIQNDDVVTYGLHVINVSDYEFSNLVIIDRLPEENDTGVVNLKEKRDSKFTVYNPEDFIVTVDGKSISPEFYTIDYSTKIEFTEGDFNAETVWDATAENAKSFRVAFTNGFTLIPGAEVVVTFDGTIKDAETNGEIAWNNFAYRYVAGKTGNDTAAVATLTPEPPKVGVMVQEWKVVGEKTWIDGDNANNTRPQSITVELQKYDINEEKWVKEAEATVTADENGAWTYQFDGLTQYQLVDNQMVEISYRVVEAEVDNYSVEYTKVTHNDNGETVANIVNTLLTEVPVAKKWVGDKENDRLASITVVLLADSEETGLSIELTKDNKWTASFIDLPAYKANEDGSTTKIVYTIEEVEVTNYISTISGDAVEGYTITNTYDLTEVPVTKKWIGDKETDRPESITVVLVADGKPTEQTVILTAENSWKATFTGLKKYNVTEDGELVEIVYTVEESTIVGYVSDITGDAVEGYTITNTYDLTEVPVTKKWVGDKETDRPESITVVLVADGEPTEQTVILTAENSWKATFTNLKKYNVADDGELVEIVYTVEESTVVGYVSDITGDAVEGYTITNTYDLTEVPVTKKWVGDKETDRPESITVVLVADGKPTEQTVILTAENSWKATFSGLKKYNVTEDGKLVEIVYTIKEVAVEGYISDITGDAVEGYTITNTYDLIDIPVTKIWVDDKENDRPESITVVLVANGKEIDQINLTVENNWEATFESLKKYSVASDGKLVEIVYTIKEVAVEGYETVITGDATEGFVITNNFNTPPVEKEEEIPKTGDNMMAMIAIMMVSGTTLATMLFLKKKYEDSFVE